MEVQRLGQVGQPVGHEHAAHYEKWNRNSTIAHRTDPMPGGESVPNEEDRYNRSELTRGDAGKRLDKAGQLGPVLTEPGLNGGDLLRVMHQESDRSKPDQMEDPA